MWRLTLKNLRGRKAFNVFIVSAVAAAVAMVLIALFLTGGVRGELEHNRRLMGADLALVPPGTKEKGRVSLVKGPPVQGAVPAEALEQLREFPEIAAATGQKYEGGALAGGKEATIITFEPATDFVVLPWLEGRRVKEFPAKSAAVVLGARVAVEKAPGDVLEVNGKSFAVAGRLREETGTFLDTAIFFPSPGEGLRDPSWILLRLRQDAYLDFMVNKLETNIPEVEVIARPEMLKTINDQLDGLLQGGAFGAATLLVILGVLLVTGAVFSLMIHERRREFGLLKAMGARNAVVFRLIVGEAAVLGGSGAILGIAAAAGWLLFADAVFVSLPFVLSRMAATLALTIAASVLTAVYPALLTAGREPYAAIRGGE
jgi:putative ABC transport system permease protein